MCNGRKRGAQVGLIFLKKDNYYHTSSGVKCRAWLRNTGIKGSEVQRTARFVNHENQVSEVQHTPILANGIIRNRMSHANQGQKEVHMSLYMALSKVIYAKQTAFYRVSWEVITLRETPFNSARLREIK